MWVTSGTGATTRQRHRHALPIARGRSILNFATSNMNWVLSVLAGLAMAVLILYLIK